MNKVFKRRMSDAERMQSYRNKIAWIKQYTDGKEFDIVYDFGSGGRAKIVDEVKLKYNKFIRYDKAIARGVITKDFEELVDLEEKADLIFCNSVLEHVWDYKQFINNIYNNLKDNGITIVVIPFMFEYHGNGVGAHDYWRWTPEGLIKIFNQFKLLKIEYVDKDRLLIGMILRK